jgi:hypothetical protein
MNYLDYNANKTRPPGVASTASWQLLPVVRTTLAERIRRALALARAKESKCKQP